MVLIYLLILAWISYAMLRELEARKTVQPGQTEYCPECACSIDADWIACPHCRSLLHDHCGGCGKTLGTYHHFCPWCGESSKGKAL
ncbi:MAG TPA: zinc ribbon domain-containing protein [Desulfuromonadales bacterium]|nr:zinc ribbon domain-containing protein [Desulfuromonadales bacterium]